MTQESLNIIREYILFVNQQVGVYLDALAGFEGHHVNITHQVHRENRPTGARFNEKSEKIVVWSVFEDSSQPDVIVSTTRRAKDFLAANAKDGTNIQQHSQAILVFIYAYWEAEIRPRLILAEQAEVNSDFMGDLRHVRHAILHHKEIMRFDKNKNYEFKILGNMFPLNQHIYIPIENMKKIFELIKQDCAKILELPEAEVIKDLAIQRFV